MKKIKKLIFYTTAVFIAGTMILIAVQYITNRNIKGLISGNENLLNEFKVSNQLTELQSDMLVFDNKIKNAIITSDTNKIRDFDPGISEIENDIAVLENVNSNDSLQKDISRLNNLVHQKLEFCHDLADSFTMSGKLAAEKLFATEKGIILSQDIYLVAQKIDAGRRGTLAKTTNEIDNSGRQAFRWGIIMIAIVLLLFTVIFWFIVTRMKKQYDLINQLNASERKIKEMMQVKENFLANMSHEIRTPMNAILGYTNLLQRKSTDPETKLHLSTIQKSGENLLSIINDILDISKIEAGMMRIEEAPFNIKDLLHSIEVMFKNRFAEKGLLLTTSIGTVNHPTLIGDATRLTQVLVNLVGNAVKFTDKGKISVAVSEERISNRMVNLIFRVADTGIGIKKEKLETIFERFIQAEETTTRKFGGTGLGLSIVKNIVEIQNGSVKIESEPGAGTTVMFNIPYKIPDIPVYVEPGEAKILLPPFEKKICILVVEDNLINQGLIAHLFNEWQVEYSIANNGKEAIAKLQQQEFDLVLMDIQMPEMDGYDATKQIRAELKSAVPVIAMTAHAMKGEREKCLSYGMNEHISKPVKEAELYKLIAMFTSQENKKEINNNFSVIDLNYMKEISNGNIKYEHEVTMQFIEMVPVEIDLMNKAFETNNTEELKQIAHNMKTTVSIMGINRLLNEHLDNIENNATEHKHMSRHIAAVMLICQKALEEARLFLHELN